MVLNFRALKLQPESAHIITDISAKTLQDLGVIEIRTREGSETTFLISPQESRTNILGFVGPEYEGAYSNSIQATRASIRKLQSPIVRKAIQEILERGDHYSEYVGRIQIFQQFKLLLKSMSPLIYQVPHEDGGGIESVLKPATLSAHHILKPEYARILSAYKEFGFTDELDGAGLHIYIDHSLFGDTVEEYTNKISYFLWFLFRCGEEMLEISNRKFSSQANADMWYLLGDHLGLLPDEQLLDKFKQQKNAALATLARKSTYGRYMNVSFNRDGRPAIEFRWFSSTMDIEVFMAFIEFGFAIPEWCRTLTDESQVSFIGFCNFLKGSVDKYSHLFQYFTSKERIVPFMNLDITTQQPLSKRRERILVEI